MPLHTEPHDTAGTGTEGIGDAKAHSGLDETLPAAAHPEPAAGSCGFVCDGVRVHVLFGSEKRELSELLADYFCGLMERQERGEKEEKFLPAKEDNK